MTYLPIAHHFAPFLPLILYAKAPDCVWVGGKRASLTEKTWITGDYVEMAYRFHWVLFLLLQLVVMILYAIPVYAPSDAIFTMDRTGFSSELDVFRQVNTGLFLGAVGLCILILRKALFSGWAKEVPELDAHESVAHTATWIVAWSETVTTLFLTPNTLPVWYAIDSPNAVTISAVFCWLYYPRDSVRSNLVTFLLLVWLSLGISLSITSWVYDIYQVESVATYMNATTYENMFIDDTTVIIRNLYKYTVPVSHIPMFSAAAITAQLQGIMWTVVGLFVATSAMGRFVL